MSDSLRRVAEGHGEVTFLFPENADHVLTCEPRPRSELSEAEVIGGYDAPDASLKPETQAAIVQWLKEHSGW